MENNSNKHLSLKISITVLALAAIVGGGAYYWGNFQKEKAERERAMAPMNAETSVTPFQNGELNTPEGFPESIPLGGVIVNSSTTNFPDQNAVQRSVMYHSEETVESKKAEYSTYLESADYAVEEVVSENGAVSLNGSKEGEMISITITTWEDFTRVYIAHLSISQN